MKRISPVLGLLLAIAGGTFAAAQDATPTPPKVIQIVREDLKMNKSGAAHDRVAATFISIATRAKQQGHYVALDFMSGKARSLYITRYPSYEAWEKDNNLVWNNPGFAAEMDRTIAAEGEFAAEINFGVFNYNEELSYHPRADLSHARYYEMTTFHIKPGHYGDWLEIVKLYKAACDKMNRGDHWAAYEVQYGAEGGTEIALHHMDSLAEIDKMLAVGDRAFVEAIGGEDGIRKFEELERQAIDSMRTELFSINPKQSYPEESWIKADPDFWKPKKAAAEAAAAKPAAPKPAAAAAKPGGN